MKTRDQKTLLRVLHHAVSHTFEDLTRLSGLSAAQVLLAVDHLSRSGEVVLRKVGMEYYISKSEAV